MYLIGRHVKESQKSDLKIHMLRSTLFMPKVVKFLQIILKVYIKCQIPLLADIANLA